MRNKQRHPGQSLVEFTLIFPLVLLLIIGFFDLGRAIFYYSSLSNAVREATRFAIVNKGLSPDEIKGKVTEYAFALTGTPNPLIEDNIIITYPTVETISVEATYTFKPITPGITLIINNPAGIDLVAQSTMRISGGSR